MVCASSFLRCLADETPAVPANEILKLDYYREWLYRFRTERFNSEGVRKLQPRVASTLGNLIGRNTQLRRSSRTLTELIPRRLLFPWLKQPWARICERRWRFQILCKALVMRKVPQRCGQKLAPPRCRNWFLPVLLRFLIGTDVALTSC
jgi:hypothetical protein